MRQWSIELGAINVENDVVDDSLRYPRPLNVDRSASVLLELILLYQADKPLIRNPPMTPFLT